MKLSWTNEDYFHVTVGIILKYAKITIQIFSLFLIHVLLLLSIWKGVWLLVGLSTPNKDTQDSTFGHMLSMLFQWFNVTACLPNDKTGTALEKLKSEYLPEWLRQVYKTHGEVFVNWYVPCCNCLPLDRFIHKISCVQAYFQTLRIMPKLVATGTS